MKQQNGFSILPRFLYLLVLVVIFAASAAGRDGTVGSWTGLSQVAQGSEIRVTLATTRVLHGFLQNLTSESLAINATDSQETLSRPDIRRIAVKRPSHRGRNTLIGLGVGTAAGLGAGAGIDSGSGPGSLLPNAGKIVFTPVGAIIGTVVGVALPTGGWHDVYRAP